MNKTLSDDLITLNDQTEKLKQMHLNPEQPLQRYRSDFFSSSLMSKEKLEEKVKEYYANDPRFKIESIEEVEVPGFCGNYTTGYIVKISGFVTDREFGKSTMGLHNFIAA